jgi:flagellar hook-associated protein 2
MNINGTSSSSTTDYSRITGLATGMDTDGMVKQAVAGEQAKIDQAKQSQQYLEWQQEAYLGVIKDFKVFQDTYLDILGPADKSMMTSASYNGTKAAPGDFNDYLDVTTYPGAIKGNYEVTIENLAIGARKADAINSINSGLIPQATSTQWTDSNKKISFEILSGDVNVPNTVVDISLSTIKENPTAQDVVNAFQSEIDKTELLGKITLTLEKGTMKITSTSDKSIRIVNPTYSTFSSLKDTLLTNSTSTKLTDITNDPNKNAGAKVNITVDGKDFSIDASDQNMTIDGLINKIRSTTRVTGSSTETLSSFVNVSYSELTKKITIDNKSTGTSSTLEIKDVTGEVAKKLGIATNSEAGIGTIITGENAIVHIKAPGEVNPITVEKISNSFTIDNIKYNLIKEDKDKPLNITIKADATDSVAKIKKFVDAYNSLIDKLNTKISEKKNYTYKPLTDTQKEEMNDDEIKKWDEQAKKGLLSRESTISNLLSNMREMLYSKVDGAGITLTDIGITTMKWSSSKIGKLEVDDDKLKTALESRGDQIQKLFTQNGNTSEAKGILQKIKDSIKSNFEGDGILLQKAGYENTRWASNNQLSKNIQAKKQQISDLQQRMLDKQQRYYQMFAALERNMNNLNSQSSWLASSLGSA